MTTVGEILKTAREKKKLTLEQVEKATRIRAKFLTALENNDFTVLPPGAFTRGFIKNYAAFLGLPGEETLAFYRRQENSSKTPALPHRPEEISPRWLSKLTFPVVATGLLVLLFFGYLLYSYLKFAGAPALVVNTPTNNSVIHANPVEVAGKTDPDAKLVINNQPIPVNETGSFDLTITLEPGINTLTFTATNKFARQTTLVRNVRLEK